MNRYQHKSSSHFKGPITALLFSLFFLVIFFGGTLAQENPVKQLSEITGILGREKSLAETYVSNLKESDDRGAQYAEGIKRYGVAKSSFTGLIESMKTGLINEEPFEESPAFDRALKTAVEKRIAFTNFISKEIIGNRQGEKGILKPLIGNPSELFSALKDIGKTIWQEYRAYKDQEREALLDQLDALKWKAPHQIGGSF